MSEQLQAIELQITPIPPHTVDSVKREILTLIESTLQEAGKDELLSEQQIDVQVERTFPTAEVVIIVVKLASAIALLTYKEVILPALKRRYEIGQQTER